MVVATGAAGGQAEEGHAGDADDVRQFILPLHQGQVDVRALHLVHRPRHKIAGRRIFPHAVTRKLLKDEPVEGLVGIHGPDDIVAIMVGIGSRRVRFKAIGFGEPNDIEPMPRPAFPMPWARQQSIHKSFVSVQMLVGDKFGHLVRRRRQTDQVEVKAANERHLIRGRRQIQAALSQFVEQIAVNQIGSSRIRRCLGQKDFNRLEGPVVGGQLRIRSAGVRPGQSLIHPSP